MSDNDKIIRIEDIPAEIVHPASVDPERKAVGFKQTGVFASDDIHARLVKVINSPLSYAVPDLISRAISEEAVKAGLPELDYYYGYDGRTKEFIIPIPTPEQQAELEAFKLEFEKQEGTGVFIEPEKRADFEYALNHPLAMIDPMVIPMFITDVAVNRYGLPMTDWTYGYDRKTGEFLRRATMN